MTVSCGAARQQRQRQGAFAGSNLDQALARQRPHRLDDARDDSGVMQEMLAEALAGAVIHPRVVPRPAISSASSSAATRLPGSARPVPAMSNAVP
jgi:hypothetical protein